MVDRIVLSENQEPEVSLIYKYEFKTSFALEDAKNVCGVDMREDVYDAIVSNFKLELYEKIYGVDKSKLLKIKNKKHRIMALPRTDNRGKVVAEHMGYRVRHLLDSKRKSTGYFGVFAGKKLLSGETEFKTKDSALDRIKKICEQAKEKKKE